jgi:thymidylate synthase
MLTIEGRSINEVWLKLLEQLLNEPEFKPQPRGLLTHEITGVTLRVQDLRNNILYHPLRTLNYRFLVAEWLWIALGREDLATLTPYNGQMGRFSDDGKTLAGAYGPRLSKQWQYVVDSIAKDEFTRQGVATIWTPCPAPSKDIPCTISIQLIARSNQLNCIVTMRSSDVWLGLPYDCFTFAQLANGIAGVLGLTPGYLQFNLGSSHLYATDFEKAHNVLADPQHYPGITSPSLPYMPNPNLSIENPYCLTDYLENPGKYPPEYLRHPWSVYAAVLGAKTWSEARRLLIGATL